jgi:hypothetical protein
MHPGRAGNSELTGVLGLNFTAGVDRRRAAHEARASRLVMLRGPRGAWIDLHAQCSVGIARQ